MAATYSSLGDGFPCVAPCELILKFCSALQQLNWQVRDKQLCLLVTSTAMLGSGRLWKRWWQSATLYRPWFSERCVHRTWLHIHCSICWSVIPSNSNFCFSLCVGKYLAFFHALSHPICLGVRLQVWNIMIPFQMLDLKVAQRKFQRLSSPNEHFQGAECIIPILCSMTPRLPHVPGEQA